MTEKKSHPKSTAELMKEANKLPEKRLPSFEDLVPDGLYPKMLWVMERVERVPRNGWNTFFEYAYATESDLVNGIRPLLAKAGLVLGWTCMEPPEFVERVRKRGGVTFLTMMKMEFSLIDAATGQKHSTVLWGSGEDSVDKGPYKAYTGGMKYFLMKTFLIPTGDDPEQDSATPAEQGQPSNGQSEPSGPPAEASLSPEELAAMCGDALALSGALHAGEEDKTLQMTDIERARLERAGSVLRDDKATMEAVVNAALWVQRLAAAKELKFSDG